MNQRCKCGGELLQRASYTDPTSGPDQGHRERGWRCGTCDMNYVPTDGPKTASLYSLPIPAPEASTIVHRIGKATGVVPYDGAVTLDGRIKIALGGPPVIVTAKHLRDVASALNHLAHAAEDRNAHLRGEHRWISRAVDAGYFVRHGGLESLFVASVLRKPRSCTVCRERMEPKATAWRSSGIWRDSAGKQRVQQACNHEARLCGVCITADMDGVPETAKENVVPLRRVR